jgi:hypothetical protein
MTGTFWKLLAVLVIIAGVNAMFVESSHAQAVGFSVSSGGGHHHHGGGGTRWSFGYGYGPWWGPGWGPGWYGPPPIIYAPPPVVQPVVQPVYIQPQTIQPVTPGTPYSATTPPTSGTLAANSVPSLTGSSSNDDRIVIRNVGSAGLPVSFLIDGQDVELTDGNTRTFVGKTHRIVQYDRGGRFGSTQQDLTGGQYEFRVTASGWDLVRKPDFAPPAGRTAVRTNALPELSASRSTPAAFQPSAAP